MNVKKLMYFLITILCLLTILAGIISTYVYYSNWNPGLVHADSTIVSIFDSFTLIVFIGSLLVLSAILVAQILTLILLKKNHKVSYYIPLILLLGLSGFLSFFTLLLPIFIICTIILLVGYYHTEKRKKLTKWCVYISLCIPALFIWIELSIGNGLFYSLWLIPHIIQALLGAKIIFSSE